MSTQHTLWLISIIIAVGLWSKDTRKQTLIAVLISMILNHNSATNELFFQDRSAFDREFELSIQEFIKTIIPVGFLLYLGEKYILDLMKKALADKV